MPPFSQSFWTRCKLPRGPVAIEVSSFEGLRINRWSVETKDGRPGRASEEFMASMILWCIMHSASIHPSIYLSVCLPTYLANYLCVVEWYEMYLNVRCGRKITVWNPIEALVAKLVTAFCVAWYWHFSGMEKEPLHHGQPWGLLPLASRAIS